MTENTEQKKRGPKPKTENEKLNKRIDRLEFVVRKMCHFSGNERILVEMGIEKWTPGKNDMKKYKD